MAQDNEVYNADSVPLLIEALPSETLHADDVPDAAYIARTVSDALAEAAAHHSPLPIRITLASLASAASSSPQVLAYVEHILQAYRTLSPEIHIDGQDVTTLALQTLENLRRHEATSEPDQRLQTLCNDYLEALLAADRRAASDLVMQAVDDGVSVRDIYIQVFQESQYEIGRRWQTNQVSVAQEHYCTAATQTIMAQLYHYIFASPRIGRNMIATSVSGELHEIGMRMVADFFEMGGWDTYYIGANAPAKTIISTLESRAVDVVCISATMQYHIVRVRDLINAIRQSDVGKSVRILVGGYAFMHSGTLWKKVGADGFGRNAAQAIDIANMLFEFDAK